MNRIIRLISARSKYKSGILIESDNLNTDARYQNIMKDLDNGVVNQDKINEFFSLITNNKANIEQPLSIIEKCDKIAPLYSKILVNTFTKNILPCIDTYLGVRNEVEKYEGIDAENKKTIKEAAEDLNVADRILANHYTLSKRFDMDKFANTINERTLANNGYDSIVNKVYELVETYDIEEYQKMNLVIEELTYLLDKNGIKYNSKALYESIMKYCLTNNESVDNITRTLKESRLIDKKDIEALVKYLTTDRKDLTKGWIKYLNRKDNKLPETLKEVFDNTPDYGLDNGIKDFAKEANLFIKSESSNISIFKGYLNELVESIIDRDLSREDLIRLYEDLEYFILESNILSEDTQNLFADTFFSPLDSEISLKYTQYNLECMEYVNEDSDPVSLPEYGLKNNALVKIINKFNKFLDRKEKNGQFSKLKSHYKSFGNNKLISALFGEDTSIYNLIGCDNRMDATVAKFYFNEDDDIRVIPDYISKALYEFNCELANDPNCTARAYYTLVEGCLEIHIKDKTILKEGEQIPVSESTVEEDYKEFSIVNPKLNYRPVLEYLQNVNECSNFTIEHFETVLESLSYLGVDKDAIQEFATLYSDYRFNHNLKNRDNIIKEYVNDWKSKCNDDIDVALEAYSILVSIFEDAGFTNLLSEETIEDRMRKAGYYSKADEEADKARTKSDDKDEDDDDDDKKSKSSKNYDDDEDDDDDYKKPKNDIIKPASMNAKEAINNKGGSKLVAAKLALQGLLHKSKEFGSKAKMAANNLDSAVRHYVKAVQDARSNERREQIIRGSVIPSFTKIIRNAITLAGMGALAYAGVIPVLVPVVAAIGGFAIDKRLTYKERLLLLDEIETELEVIDKEMSIAEGNSQMNKLRALMRYKKVLQRQYQRIRYNVRVGKDIGYVPSSIGQRSNADE